MTDILSVIARSVVRGMEAARLRGAPILFRALSKLPGLSNKTSTVALSPTRTISFPTFDPYWCRYLWGGKPYEPDVEMIFRKLAAFPGKLLIDCGANIGFWMVQVSQPDYGFSDFIAVEANPALIPLLAENIRANRIDCRLIHAAIASEGGRTVRLGGTEHHASAAVGEEGVPIKTVSIAQLIEDAISAGTMIVVKLDVEGSEIEAIRGGRPAVHRDMVYIVEDWPRSGMTVTRFLLEEGFGVIGVGPDGSIRKLISLEEAFEFNRASTTIYQPSNLVACRMELVPKLLDLFRA